MNSTPDRNRAAVDALKRLPAGTAVNNTGQAAARLERGQADTAPGAPPGFPEPETLMTEECIQPQT